MATAPSALPPLPEPIWRWSVERYHEAIRAGIFTPEDRLELLEGVLVEQMSKNPPHVGTCAALHRQISNRLPAGWILRAQEPLTLASSEPEPDLAVVRADASGYFYRHPGAAETALVVEVADSTVFRDRTIKKRVYARAGIAVYWLVDLNARVVEVYTQPVGDDYTLQVTVSSDGALALALGEVVVESIAVSDMLPPLG
jgi:Uma2 family endonuclease